jgi:hypothetical protein
MHDIKQDFFAGILDDISQRPSENAIAGCRVIVYESAPELKILTAGVPFS